MRILYITLENLSLHKGSVVHVKEIISSLRNNGHYVGLVACSFNKFEKADCFYNLNVTTFFPLSLFRFNKQPYVLSLIILFLYLFIIQAKHDIIYVREYPAVLVSLLPRFIFNKKLIFEINGIASEEQGLKSDSLFNNILVALIQRAEKMATRCSDRIVSVTPQIMSYLVSHFYYPAHRIVVVGNGVDTKKFYPLQDKVFLEECKERLGIGKEEIIIGFAGSLAPWQGVEYLIEVAPLLIKEVKNVKFLIIGDGLLREEFKRGVSNLGLSNHFVFMGMIDYEQIPLYINIADICVLLKRKLKSGYSPIKLYEYMACGKPVVATRVEGLEVIEEERTGRLIEPGDVIGLKETLRDLIGRSQERAEMGRKGIQLVNERFRWESRATKIQRTMRELA